MPCVNDAKLYGFSLCAKRQKGFVTVAASQVLFIVFFLRVFARNSDSRSKFLFRDANDDDDKDDAAHDTDGYTCLLAI